MGDTDTGGRRSTLRCTSRCRCRCQGVGLSSPLPLCRHRVLLQRLTDARHGAGRRHPQGKDRRGLRARVIGQDNPCHPRHGRGPAAGRLCRLHRSVCGAGQSAAPHADVLSLPRPACRADAEHAFDRTYARKCGVNVDEAVISQPECGENALEVIGPTSLVPVPWCACC